VRFTIKGGERPIIDYRKKQTRTLGISGNIKFTNDDVMKYVIGPLQLKLPREPYPLIRLWVKDK